MIPGVIASYPNMYGTYLPESQAIFDEMVPPPYEPYKKAIDDLIRQVIGFWHKFDAFYIYHSYASQPALLNWKNPIEEAVLVNSPVFHAFSGFQGDGVSTRISIPTLFSAYTLNNAHFSVSQVSNSSPLASNPLLGCTTTSSSTRRIGYFPRNATNARPFQLNDNLTVITQPTIDPTLLTTLNRTTSGFLDVYDAGVLTSTVAAASTNLPAPGSVLSLAYDFTSSADQFGNMRANILTFGGALDAGEIATLNTAWLAYKAAMVLYEPPTASDVSISGTLEVGETVTGTYTYSGTNAESGSTFQWYVADDAIGTGVMPISGATSLTYDIPDFYGTKYLSFRVRPSDGDVFGTPVFSAWTGPVEFAAESEALFAEMSPAPTLLERMAIDKFMKAAWIPVWAKMDAIYILHSYEEQPSRVNWKNPTEEATAVNSPVFHKYSGWQGDGVSSHLTFPTALTNYTQNNSHIGGTQAFNIPARASNPLFGDSAASSGAVRMGFLQRSATNMRSFYMNSSTVNQIASIDSTLLTVMNRTVSTGFDVYDDGVLFGTQTMTSAGLPVLPIVGMRYRSTTTVYGVTRPNILFYGSSLTAPEIEDINDAWEIYKTEMFWPATEGGRTFQNESLVLFGEMEPYPSLDKRIVMDDLMVGFKTVWSKLDALYVLHSYDEQPSLVDWKNPYQVAVPVSSPIFHKYSGWQGNGAGAYISIPTPIVNYVQNSAHVGSSQAIALGVNTGPRWSALVGTDERAYYWPVTATNETSLKLNSSSADTIATPLNETDYNLMSRTASANYRVYVTGVTSFWTVTRSSTSTMPTSFRILEFNGIYGIVRPNLLHFGSGLTQAEGIVLNDAWEAYKVAMYFYEAPNAEDVAITGTVQEGRTVNGVYTYVGSGNESGSTYQWYSASDAIGTGSTPISGETSETLEIDTPLAGQYIAFGVVASDGVTSSTEVLSDWSLVDALVLLTETDALIAEMTVPPTLHQTAIINDFMTVVVASWAKFDAFHVMHMHDAQAALLNWKNPSESLVLNGGITFDDYGGLKGNRVDGWVEVVTALSNYAQNDAHFGSSQVAVSEAGFNDPRLADDTDLSDLSTARRITYYATQASGLREIRLNDDDAQTTSAVGSNNNVVVSRSASGTYSLYGNGVFASNITSASLSITGRSFVLFRARGGSEMFYGNMTLNLFHFGSALTPTEITNLYNAFEAFKLAMVP